MARKRPEWIGRTDDTPVPAKVQERISRDQNDCCAKCGKPFGPHKDAKANCDHIVPLRDGGENRQSNLQMLCNWCHVLKTAGEATSRAKTTRIRKKHLGIDAVKTNRWQSRGFPKAEPQRTATRPIVRKSERAEA